MANIYAQVFKRVLKANGSFDSTEDFRREKYYETFERGKVAKNNIKIELQAQLQNKLKLAQQLEVDSEKDRAIRDAYAEYELQLKQEYDRIDMEVESVSGEWNKVPR